MTELENRDALKSRPSQFAAQGLVQGQRRSVLGAPTQETGAAPQPGRRARRAPRAPTAGSLLSSSAPEPSFDVPQPPFPQGRMGVEALMSPPAAST